MARKWVFLAVWLGAAAAGENLFAAMRPNIVLIVADDLGFSDLGCYGSEILTPNLDRLADGGLRFSQFYSAGRGCPTRAALLTGLYPHQVGMGHMTNDFGRPGYTGELGRDGVTLAEALGKSGYQTMMCGKWHLTQHVGRDGPKFNWPVQRGFREFYGTLAGAGSYFDPFSLTHGNTATTPPGDFYYTDAIGERCGAYIERAARSDRPFFLYAAFTAPHWPLHARPEIVARYRGKYAAGWDALRQARHKRMISLGLVSEKWPLAPRDPRVLPWEQAPQRDWHQRRMEVYAAQVDTLDRAVGRILDKLKQTGADRNTLILFLSDNGGCAEELPADWRTPLIPAKTRTGQLVQPGNRPSLLPGTEDTYQSYGVPWAGVSNTPFRLYKHWVHEGGVATPLIVSWPGVIPAGRAGRIVEDVGHVVDLMPSCLEAALTPYPREFEARPILPCAGVSLVPVFRGQPRQRGAIYWEHEGNRAVRADKWKLVSRYPGKWELYDMQADRTELNDLAEKYPTIVNHLARLYDQWAARSNVVPWGTLSTPPPPKKAARPK